MIESSLVDFIESQLTFASRRQQTFSANIANADTPGYRAQDVRFESQMQLFSMARTSAGHITPLQSNRGFQMFDVDTEAKPNGNTVDLDRELTEVTTNGLQFITLMQFLQSKLQTLRSSISEGGF